MFFDPLYSFVFAGMFSPGPNVILLTASGARFGFRATLPHVIGVAFGVGLIAAVTAYGLGAVLLAMPWLKNGLKILAALWILYLAWRLFRSSRAAQTKGTEQQPFTINQAVLFQWVNPKIWVVALAATAGYASDLTLAQEALRMGVVFTAINLFVGLFYSKAGQLLTRLFASDSAWRGFMTVMALLLAVSALMVFV